VKAQGDVSLSVSAGDVTTWAARPVTQEGATKAVAVLGDVSGDGVSPLQLPLALFPIFLIGLLLAVVYLRTGNLFLAAGLHALNDYPTVLFSRTFLSNDLQGLIIVFIYALLLLFFWALFTRRRLQRQHAYKR
jgi:hypothetical protein